MTSLVDRTIAQMEGVRRTRIAQGWNPSSSAMRQLDRARANLTSLKKGRKR